MDLATDYYVIQGWQIFLRRICEVSSMDLIIESLAFGNKIYLHIIAKAKYYHEIAGIQERFANAFQLEFST